MECQYCKKILKTKSALSYHQRTTQYCLKIQGKQNNCHKCQFCNRTTTTHQSLQQHFHICSKKQSYESAKNAEIEIAKLKLENKKYKKENKKLQEKLDKVLYQAINKPTTTTNYLTNNTQIQRQINNLVPLTEEHLQDQAKHLTIEYLKRGGSGIAEFALEHPLKDRILCVDFSRKKVVFKDEDGNVVNDPDAAKITEMIFKSIADHNNNNVEKYKELEYKKAGLHEDCTDEERDKVSDALKIHTMKEMGKVFSLKRQVEAVAKGESSENMVPEFKRKICAQSSI